MVAGDIIYIVPFFPPVHRCKSCCRCLCVNFAGQQQHKKCGWPLSS